MTKRVRVLKEMPFAKVGFEYQINLTKHIFIGGMELSTHELEDLIDRNWLEWVEEDKSLAQKYKDIGKVYDNTAEEMAQIADIHYKEYYQKKFDEAADELHGNIGMDGISTIRKAMFGEE